MANSGFESGTLASWSKNTVGADASDAQVSHTSDQIDNSSQGGPPSTNWYIYPAGSSMARLQPNGSSSQAQMFSDLGLNATAQTAFSSAYPDPTNFAYIYQSVSLNAGDTVTLAWNYVATDYSPYNDASVATFVKTGSPSSTGSIAVGAYTGVSSQLAIIGSTDANGNYITGDFGSSGWQTIKFTASSTGTWKIGFAVFNLSDTINSPVLYLDNAAGTTYSGGPQGGGGTFFGPIGANGDVGPPPPTQTTPTITWAAPAAITYGTVLSGTQLNASASAAGTFAYTPASGTALSAGSQTISVTFTPTDSTTYTTATGSVSLTVNKITPTITWATPVGITYGTALSVTQLNAASATAGTFAYTPASGTILSAGSRTLSVTFTPTDLTNYNSATGSVSLPVNQITPTVTWATPSAITYGATLNGTQLNASANTTGSFAYTPVSGSLLSAGSHSLSVAFTPTDATNYSSATGSVSISVAKATPSLTWGTPSTLAYGTALSSTQLNAAASTTGLFAYSPASGTFLSAGSHTLSATFTPTDGTNFNPTSGSVTVLVGQATPTITWATPSAVTYGTALSSTQLNAASSTPGTFAYAPASGTLLSTGSRTLSVTFTPTDSVNYTAASGSVFLSVNQATPSITWATPSAITYGAALSSAQLNATSSAAGSFAYAPASGTVLSAGSRALSVTFTPTDAVNYSTATSSVSLAVTPATPTITWSSPSTIGYGTALGSTQLNAASNTPGSFVYTPGLGTILSGGSHALSVTFTPTDSVNYSAVTGSATISVSLATPTITWTTPSPIIYGTPLSSTQLNAAAIVAGSFTYSPALGTILSAGSHLISVTFTPTDLTNFTTATASVSVTLSKATPALTWATPNSVVSGTVLSSAQLNASTSVSGSFSYTPGSGLVLATGLQNLSVLFTPADPSNYTTATAAVNVAVTAPLQVNQTITFPAIGAQSYGAPPVALSATASSGLAVTYVVTNGPGTISGHLLTITGAGAVTVTASQAGNSAYNAATDVSQTIGVGKLTPTLTWPTPAATFAGGSLSATQLNAIASIPGTFTYTPIAGSIPAAGTQTVSVVFIPTDSDDYNAVSASVNLLVNYHSPVISGFTPDTGVLGDNLTNANTLTLSGTAQPGTTVAVSDHGTFLGNATVSLTGAWTFTTPALESSTHSFTTITRDNQGNQSTASSAYPVTISLSLDAVPTILSFSPDTGVVGDSLTSATLLTLAGTAVPGGAVSFFDAGTFLGSTTADSAGRWTFLAPSLPAAAHRLVASTTDVAANLLESSPFVIRVVTAPPTISAPTTVNLTAPQSVLLSSATALVIADPTTTSVTVTLNVPHGGLTLANASGATVLVGTGSNDLAETLQGTLAQVNAALSTLSYQPALAGLPLSLDVLQVIAQGDSGLSHEIDINLFTTREALGGGQTSIPLSSQVPPGKVLSSGAVTQWDSTLLSHQPAVASDGTLNFIAVDGQDGGVSTTSIVVHLGFTDGSSSDLTVPVTIYHPLLTVLSSVDSPTHLNPQTSYYEQSIQITNTTPFALISFTISVPNLPAGVLLESASGYDVSGVPFITGIAQLDSGAATTLTLEYFSPNAKPFANPAVKLQLQQADRLPTTSGTVTPPTRVVTAYLGRTYVQFPTVAGNTYWIQYRDSAASPWQTSYVPVLGSGSIEFWMDNGAPKTSSIPTAARLYQLLVSSPLH